MAYKLEKLVIGGFLYFVESGTLVDGVTVDENAFPDVDPIDNWNSLGFITEVNPETEKETDTDYCPSPAGGYEKVDDERVVADYWKFITREHSEPFWRMLLGLRNEIQNGVAQTPLDEKRRYIDGWLKVQARADDGVDRLVMNIYGRLSLDANPKWSKDPTKPALSFQKLYSAVATVEPNGIVAA